MGAALDDRDRRSTTRIASAARIVDSRWAMTSAVRPVERGDERLLDGGLGLGVEVGGRLVEDDDPRLGQQQPGDRQALALAAGQAVAALADDGVEAVGERRARASPSRACSSAAHSSASVASGAA